jgi:guanylate kinase
MKKSEKIVLVGKSGSGKDYLSRKLFEMGLVPCVKTTTRPARIGEEAGKDYHFISEKEFSTLEENRELVCKQIFYVTPQGREPEVWYYGITKSEFQKSNLFIMTPGELNQISEESLFIVYLDIDRETREKRLTNREDKNDSIKRRLDSDEKDFLEFDRYDLKITDPEFEASLVYDFMF